MNHANSGLAHGTNGSPQLVIENNEAEHKASENEKNAAQDVVLPTGEAQLKHIFGERAGHLPDTPENRSTLTRLARDSSKFVGNDKYGNSWNVEITSEGFQNWVRYRNSAINEGGQNRIPKTWNPETGLNSNPEKRPKRRKRNE